MSKIYRLAMLGCWMLACLLAAGAAQAAGFAALKGVWRPIGDAGFDHVKITVVGGRPLVQAFGRCSPNPCDWGRARLVAYAPDVSTDPAQETIALSASYDQGFKETLLTLRPLPKNRLRISVFSRFKRGDRSPYFATAVYSRQRQLQIGTAQIEREPRRTLHVAQPPSPPPPPVLGGPSPAGDGNVTRRILPDGSVELTYPDGTRKILSDGRVEVIPPGGPPRMLMMHQAVVPLPPVPPSQQSTEWLSSHAARLQGLVATLVDHDEASLAGLASLEASDPSLWNKIQTRADMLGFLLTP